MRHAKYLIFVLLLVANNALSDNSIPLVAAEDILPNPLRVGEKLTYKISWKKLPAGKRTDWIVKQEVRDGQDVYRIQSETKTGAFFRPYKFRNQQEMSFNPTTLSPVHFQNHLQDRKYLATVTIDFRDGEADYEKVSRPKPEAPRKREAKVLEIPPGTQDELSVLYFLRSKQLALGKTYFLPLIVKGKVLKVILTVERREFVKNKKLGNVRTLVLRTSKGDRFWITDDKRRLPVKIETESKMGALKATLNDIELTN